MCGVAMVTLSILMDESVLKGMVPLGRVLQTYCSHNTLQLYLQSLHTELM